MHAVHMPVRVIKVPGNSEQIPWEFGLPLTIISVAFLVYVVVEHIRLESSWRERDRR